MTLDAASVLIDGPWEHTYVPANGARFHVAQLGEGPLVLLMHGFPQFWYAWRHVMPAIADAGYRVAAMDLRGYGASDKPPRGYDTYTGAADAAALIRSLGESEAIVVGQGLGAWIAWTMPSLQPGIARALACLSMPHPRVMRLASLRVTEQMRASRYVLLMQRPFVPERLLERDHELVERLMRAWASPYGEFPTAEDVRRYGEAMQLPFVAHSAAEHYRWIGRTQIRPDGPLFNRRIKGAIDVPVLHLQGTEDGAVLAEATDGSQRYVTGPYRRVLIDGAGHFLAEESPARVCDALTSWLTGTVDRTGTRPA